MLAEGAAGRVILPGPLQVHQLEAACPTSPSEGQAHSVVEAAAQSVLHPWGRV